MNSIYIQKVELLLRILPVITQESCFAVHGGTAINLFVKDLPRYSVDIDLTYIPLEDRITSIENINWRLVIISDKIRKLQKGIRVTHRADVCKLLCEYQGKNVKIEVNQTKRGLVCGEALRMPLCHKAQQIFRLYCEANVVPLPLLYGGKIAAALSRQHPRDLFDVRYMDVSLESVKDGFIFCLLGSDRPVYETFAPNLIDQQDALVKQFTGMTLIDFTYNEYEAVRSKLICDVNDILTGSDKQFLIDFESGEPNWNTSEYSSFKNYPSILWKQLNIQKLKETNPEKFNGEVTRLKRLFNV
jgi:predicted nucleotidyltransferase component of viral defense system